MVHGSFSGTSSASPIVAGAIAALQGVRTHRGQPRLTATEVRSLLRSTGTAQASSPKQIGPLPNLRAAINIRGIGGNLVDIVGGNCLEPDVRLRPLAEAELVPLPVDASSAPPSATSSSLSPSRAVAPLSTGLSRCAARRLGIRPNNVKIRLHRARLALRALVHSHFAGERAARPSGR